MKTRQQLAVLTLLGAFAVLVASAQEVLPAPPKPFKGKIGRTVKDSKSDFPKLAIELKPVPASMRAELEQFQREAVFKNAMRH